ncbi:hypothetical protein QC764_602990 [Podospora pseudoanserina]|uniref:Uncharacterized protein n=1 Tax=Podospora pseudoanserina TaxID=2609844 RepID=A0ABR0HTV3_9PEZI|nr:hypothetical protein QC764_602990 [Podospora pseudoanserina]
MAQRYSYTEEHLLFLRQSPLCVKPPGLPPAEEWMGPPPETFRNQPGKVNDARKGGDSLLLGQENRRPTLDRNASRTSGFADDLILGPPRNAFASATAIRGARSGDADKGSKDLDRPDRTDRFNFRNRTNDADSTGDRLGRDNHNRDGKDGRNNNGFRRRGDQDQDTEGWSTVKPRKSFGAEGAERFQGRMGGAGTDRFPARDDRRTRDREDQDGGNRRTFRPRDQEDEDPEAPRRNGLTRGKTDLWFSKDSGTATATEASTGQKHIERKSWRDRAPPEERPAERHNDRQDRNFERRWDRQQKVENDPEWMAEPAEEPSQGRTADDFRKFMEAMKSGPKSDEKPASIALDKPSTDSFFELEPKVLSAPAVENRPDKFFEAFGGTGLDAGAPAAEAKDAARPKGAKPSRFLSFLAQQENGQPKAEPPTPAPTASAGDGKPPSGEADKLAFQQLIEKLHSSRLGGSGSPTPNGPPPPGPPRDAPGGLYNLMPQKSNVASPEPFQQYGNDRRDDPRFRPPPQLSPYEMMTSRMGLPGPSHSPPVSRPEHALQELLSQRQSQSNPRGPQTPGVVNENTEFLMHLMQGHRRAEPMRPEQRQPDQHLPEQLLARMQQQQQSSKQGPLPGMPDREHLEYQRERSASQRQQQLRGQPGPQGFMDESQFHPGDLNARPPQQPTQILQRPMPPPGLDHQMHPFHMGGPSGGAGPAPQMQPQRPMIPPPGLLNSGPRNANVGPMPGMQFPPNFPPPHGPPGPSNFPSVPLPPHIGGPPPGPPEGMAGPPRQMQPPPGFFGGPPPPGFMGPPGMGFPGGPGAPGGPGGPGPDGLGPSVMGYGGLPSPFDRMERMDRRGMMPPPGNFRG